MRTTTWLAAVWLASTVYASRPGQPLDCSDWVFLEPGLSCTLWYDASGLHDYWFSKNAASKIVDNQGRLIIVNFVPDTLNDCYTGPPTRLEIKALGGDMETLIGYVEPRQGPQGVDAIRTLVGFRSEGCEDQRRRDDGPIVFDPLRGRLLVALESVCFQQMYTSFKCPVEASYERRQWIAAIEGFATTFDILQTFTPTANALGFRVPYMPEGLPAAADFDTYYGPLTHPIDFTQAQGLACSYPAAVPAVGDYLEVADTLPDPAPGTGRYYVTAATHQGQTRYGRKTINRVMSGRDPAVLPACAPPD